MNYKLLYYAHATHLGLFVGRCQNDAANGFVASEQVQADWGFICRSNTDTKEQQIQYIEDVFGADLNQLVTDYLPISKVSKETSHFSHDQASTKGLCLSIRPCTGTVETRVVKTLFT